MIHEIWLSDEINKTKMRWRTKGFITMMDDGWWMTTMFIMMQTLIFGKWINEISQCKEVIWCFCLYRDNCNSLHSHLSEKKTTTTSTDRHRHRQRQQRARYVYMHWKL